VASFEYDAVGKLDLSSIYNRPDPTDYFATLAQLDYCIPQHAKPVFERVVEARREAAGQPELKVVDVGCSYGVNAALLKHGLSMAELYDLYDGPQPHDRQQMLTRDRAVYGDPLDRNLEFVGIDLADRAISYAVDAGALDAGIATDLESSTPTADDLEAIGGMDLIISTGCYGYVSEVSLERLLESSPRQPWMAHLVLRMFEFDAAEEMLSGHGYVTEKVDGLLPQRRFASGDERAHVLDNLAAMGLETAGAEAEGWYFAELFVSRPEEAARTVPIGELVGASVPARSGWPARRP
jgi:SAM-dependent methyltransferase